MNNQKLIINTKKLDIEKVIDKMISDQKDNSSTGMARVYVSKNIFDQGVEEGLFLVRGEWLTRDRKSPYATYKKEAFIHVQ